MTRFFTIFCFAFAALFTSSVNAQFVDNFDSYGTGVDVDGMNGWKGWDGLSVFSASTSADQALSAPNSIAIVPATAADTTDLVNELSGPITSGRWVMTVDQFVPGGFDGNSFFIMLNTYNDGALADKNWSVELQFFGDGIGTVLVDDFQLPQKTGWEGVAINVDLWTQIKVCVDLDLDTVHQYYDGVLIPNTVGDTGEGGRQWSERGSGAGAPELGALNLFAAGDVGLSTVFYDNVELKAVVLGDANDDGFFTNIDIASFVMALTMPTAYEAMFPGVDTDCVLDMNNDGVFSNTDIAAFVAALTAP